MSARVDPGAWRYTWAYSPAIGRVRHAHEQGPSGSWSSVCGLVERDTIDPERDTEDRCVTCVEQIERRGDM